MSSFTSGVFDYKEIGKIYREKLGGPPFPITQEIPLKPNVKCDYVSSGCKAEYNPNTQTWSPGCTGACNSCD